MIYGKPCGSPSKSNELFVKICWLRQVALLWFALLHGEGGMQRRYAQSQPVFMDPQHLQFARSVTWSSITAALPGVRPFPFHSKHFLSLCGLFLIIYDQVDYRIRPRSNSVFSPVSSCLDNVLNYSCGVASASSEVQVTTQRNLVTVWISLADMVQVLSGKVKPDPSSDSYSSPESFKSRVVPAGSDSDWSWTGADMNQVISQDK